jgi:chromosome condensin MukBEF ATPase and DNA-binding subunit MukB
VSEAVFILLEFPSPSRRIFIGSHSLPPSLVRRIGPSPVLEQKRTKAKQFVKDSQAQIQNNKELLAELQPALELKIARKAALEAELKNLTAEIEADKKR